MATMMNNSNAFKSWILRIGYPKKATFWHCTHRQLAVDSSTYQMARERFWKDTLCRASQGTECPLPSKAKAQNRQTLVSFTNSHQFGSTKSLYKFPLEASNLYLHTCSFFIELVPGVLIPLQVYQVLEQCTCAPVKYPVLRIAEGKYRMGEQKSLIFVRVSAKIFLT